MQDVKETCTNKLFTLSVKMKLLWKQKPNDLYLCTNILTIIIYVYLIKITESLVEKIGI